jgi:hypothetical protein
MSPTAGTPTDDAAGAVTVRRARRRHVGHVTPAGARLDTRPGTILYYGT